ncbi:MAG TPA: RNA-binding protein [Flavisolibacter sp.]|jgi:RNA recognition motif-containing protein|nr:RNA-binding protein [Flavisolibacter sp.]
MNIYVSNLSFNVQDEDLKEFFTPYGEVSSAKVITDRETGKSRGFGFVEMSDDSAAQKAIAELDQATVEGRAIRVVEAKPKEDKPARSGGGGGGYRGGNGGGYNGGGSGGYNKNRY